MKNQISSAQIVLPCEKFNRSLEFFVERLGFRVEMIFPADAPSVAVLSGYGTTLRLEHSKENAPLALRLLGDFSAETAREIRSPDGVRIILVDEESPIEVPDGEQKFFCPRLKMKIRGSKDAPECSIVI